MPRVKTIAALLPTGKVFDRVYEVIASSARSIGASCSRVGEELGSAIKTPAAGSALEAADLIITEVTSTNPHVMYKAGYAHGRGKPILFLTQHGETFPFVDIEPAPIIYGTNYDFLAEELLSYLKDGKAKETSKNKSSDTLARFEQIFGEILRTHQYQHRGEIKMENDKTFILLNQEMDLPLVQDLARKARELGVRIKLM